MTGLGLPVRGGFVIPAGALAEVVDAEARRAALRERRIGAQLRRRW
jgi:hypothetical protein